MQSEVSQQCTPRGRMADIAMAVSRAAFLAILLTWAPSSIGGANDSSEPDKSTPVPPQADRAKEAPAEEAHGLSDGPNRPTCAELGVKAANQSAAAVAGSRLNVGCGVGNQLAGTTPASNYRKERAVVAIFLAWHVQAR